MSVESIEIISQNLTLEVQNGVTHTLEVTDGIQLELTLGVMGLQGPQGPAGTGDMQKSTYDTTNNGIVDAAESVPWTGVTGKPSTFTPSAHTHVIDDVTGLQTALDGKEAADGTILKEADIGTLVQAYDADLTSWAGITPSTKLDATGGAASNLTITSTKEIHSVVSGTDIDLSLGNVFSKTVTGVITFTVSNIPISNTVSSFVLELTNGGSAAVTWWSGVKWAGGTAPILTVSGLDILGFYTRDAGTTWRGMIMSKDNK